MKSKTMTYFLITFLSFSIFATFSSYSFGRQANLRTSQEKIFDGLYANYTYNYGVDANSSFKYVHDSGDFYNVTWWIEAMGSNSWLENIQTRLTSSASGGFGNGVHTPVWVFTNLSIGNLTNIVVDGAGDHPYNVTEELTVNYPGFGSLNVWVLEDLWYSTLAWYERSTGLLINGTFQWFGGSYTFTLTDTNMVFPQSEAASGIPGFEIILVLPIISIVSLIILRRRKKVLGIKF